MSGNVPATNADLYAVVDLTKKKSGSQVSSKKMKSDIPIYHVLEHGGDKSNKEGEKSHQQLSNNPQGLYSEIDYSKKSQKSFSTRNQQTSPQQIPMTSLNKSDRRVAVSDEERNKKPSLNSSMLLTIVLILFVIMLLFIIAVAALTVITFLRLSTIEADLRKNMDRIDSDIEALQMAFSSERANTELQNEIQDNATIIFNQTLQNLSEDVQDVNMSVNVLNHFIENANISSILSTFKNSISYSCLEIGRKLNFSNSSGYFVVSSAGVLRSVYCDLTRTFGGNSTGWMRVAELDVNNCPPGMRTETVNTSTTCKVSEDGAGCTEIYYPVYNISYTQVTGRIRAYQLNTLDGFVSLDDSLRTESSSTNTLDSNYLDGVSITTNSYHVWSFAGGCNCTVPQKPEFIGDHYICNGSHYSKFMKLHEELIWKNQQCNEKSDWFFRTSLPSNATDIRVRICRDQDRYDEDIALTELEIYIH